MKINLNEEITNYIESIIEELPVYKKAEKRFIKDLKNDIQDLIYSNPNMNINHIIETFGEPQDVIQDYINNANIKKENILLKIQMLMKNILYRNITKTRKFKKQERLL